MVQFNSSNPAESFQQAIRLHQAGQLDQAQILYRQVLAIHPQHVDALHNLGILACQQNQFATAIELFLRAIALAPNHSLFHSNLGEAYRRAGQPELAREATEKALMLDPANRDASVNLALYLNGAGQMDQALRVCRDALQRDDRQPLIHRSIGDAHLRLKDFRAAAASYERALQLLPELADARFNLGMAFVGLGRLDEAAAVFRVCIQRAPQDADAQFQLAEILSLKGESNEALRLYQAALQCRPERPDIAAGIANTLKGLARVDEALAAYRLAIQLDPKNPVTIANFANTLRDTGQHEAAIAAFGQALALDPSRAVIRSALILTYYLCSDTCTHVVQEEKARWNALHALPLAATAAPHGNIPNPDRPLRIGYVSSDLRDHPVGHFLRPVLEHHDRKFFAVFCYFNHQGPDGFTARLRCGPHTWRDVAHLNDQQLANLIRSDQIDILVDLNMHTIGNRLTMLAQKPAPVQISYLAYTDGPGLSCIDYHLTDPYLDPPAPIPVNSPPTAAASNSACDQPLRLPECFWCYFAPEDSATSLPPVCVADPPALAAGWITFGSLNYFSKLTPPALAVWAQVLNRVARSRLILHVPLGEPQARVTREFLNHGIAPDRLRLVPRVHPNEYYQLYNSIDIALDPFPYVGGTTTCDALFMGVPVVTLAGESPTSRGGLSILSNLNLPELIAYSTDQYVAAAVEWASNLERLGQLRRTLRTRLQQSPLMRVESFTRHLEDAYRSAWRGWCFRDSQSG